MSAFSDRLRGLRAETKLTQAEMAAVIKVSRTAYSNWEGDRATPDPKTLVELAEFFHVSVDYLLGNTNTRPAYAPSKEMAHELDVLLRNGTLEGLSGEAQVAIAGFIKLHQESEMRKKNKQ